MQLKQHDHEITAGKLNMAQVICVASAISMVAQLVVLLHSPETRVQSQAQTLSVCSLHVPPVIKEACTGGAVFLPHPKDMGL